MRGRVSDQDGMTLVEVLVAATILITGIAFAVVALNGSRALSLKSERVDQAVAVGQREIEKLRSLPFDRLATKTLPSNATQQPGTLALLTEVGGVLSLKVDVPPSRQTFVPANAAGAALESCIAPVSVPDTTACPADGRITSGVTRGKVTRYVTWQNSCLNLTLASACAGVPPLQLTNQDAKRVTVIVTLDGVARDRQPSSVVTDSVVTL